MLRHYIYSEKSKNIYFNTIKNPSADTAIIFLHGLCSSRRSWGNLYDGASCSASLYFVDLLGYGFSAKPDITYTLENHILALKKFIDETVTEEKIIFVGHSLGSIVALGYTSIYPERVDKTILTALPYYHSAEEARRYASTTSRFSFIFSYNLGTKILCTLLCSVFGSVTRQISPYFLKNNPKYVAQDGFLHTYNSYISTLTNVIYEQNLLQLLNARTINKLTLIHGTHDTVVPIANIDELVKRYNLPLIVEQNARHNFPILTSTSVMKVLAR